MNRLEWTEHSVNDLYDRYSKLLEWVRTISKEENSILEIKFYAHHSRKLLIEIGEL